MVDRHDLGPHQTLVFKTALTNIGSSYHQPTGVFTCKVPGVYVFYCNIVMNPNSPIALSIVKDGIDLTYTYQPIGYYQASTMAITHLSLDESVWIRLSSKVSIGNVFEDVYNSFSGFLLYQDI